MRVARTITVTDDESHVEARVVVERSDTGQEITRVELSTTNGRGLRSADLLLLEELGLRMPEPRGKTVLEEPAALPAAEASPEPAPAPEPVAAKPAVAAPRGRRRTARSRAARDNAGRTRAERAAAGQGRAYRLAPAPAELQRLYAELGGPARIAERLGVPTHTVSGWMKRMRSQGVTFGTRPPGEQQGPTGEAEQSKSGAAA